MSDNTPTIATRKKSTATAAEAVTAAALIVEALDKRHSAEKNLLSSLESARESAQDAANAALQGYAEGSISAADLEALQDATDRSRRQVANHTEALNIISANLAEAKSVYDEKKESHRRELNFLWGLIADNERDKLLPAVTRLLCAHQKSTDGSTGYAEPPDFFIHGIVDTIRRQEPAVFDKCKSAISNEYKI
jgi:hypothetical protein